MPRSPSPASRTRKAPSGALTVGVSANLITLDPANANDTLSQSAARLLLEGLLGFDKDMKVIPLLAESYDASEDAMEFTFHLRRGIKFHDGTPFDAQAVKVNFERVANPANHLKRQSLLAPLDHVEVVDRVHRQMRAEEPVRRVPADGRASGAATAEPGRDPEIRRPGRPQSGRHRPVQLRELEARHAEGDRQSRLLAEGTAAT